MSQVGKSFEKGSLGFYDDALMKEVHRKNMFVVDFLNKYRKRHFKLAMFIVVVLLAYSTVEGMKWYFVGLNFVLGLLASLLYSLAAAKYKTVMNPEFRNYVDTNGKDYSRMSRMPTEEELKQLSNSEPSQDTE